MAEGIKINIDKEKDSQTIEICERYWDIDLTDFNYKFNVKSIADKFGLTAPRVSEIASFCSSLTTYCENCGNEIKTYKKRSLINFDNVVFDGKIICKKCRTSSKLDKSVANREEILSRLSIAVKNAEWKKLNIRELELLVIITKCKTKNDVMRLVFQGMDYKSEYSKVIWERLNLLDEMGLIWIERTEDRKIIDYHTSGELKEKLEKEFPQFYADEFVPDFEKLQIMLQKIPLKTSHNQPDYSGFFNVKEEIMFKPNVQYSYGAWVNDDGTIFFKIEPAKNQYDQGYGELETPF